MYQTKAADQVSRYRPHLDQSLTWIAQSEVNRAAAIIDVGGGEAMLVDDLPAQGYQDITVLDISSAALAVARERWAIARFQLGLALGALLRARAALTQGASMGLYGVGGLLTVAVVWLMAADRWRSPCA